MIAFAAQDLGGAPELPVGVWFFTIVTLTAGIATVLKGRYGREKLSRAEDMASRRLGRVRA